MTDEVKREVEFVEVTWTRAVKVFWGFSWRAFLILLLAWLAIGTISAILFVVVGDPETAETVRTIGKFVALIMYFPVGVFVTKIILQTRFSDFRIVLTKE